jgi:hypothetical protein
MRLNVTMVSDAHATIDNKLLTAAQIIGHHNALQWLRTRARTQ